MLSWVMTWKFDMICHVFSIVAKLIRFNIARFTNSDTYYDTNFHLDIPL